MDSYFDVFLVQKARIINILTAVLISLKQQTPELLSRTPLLHIGSSWDSRLKALRENPDLQKGSLRGPLKLGQSCFAAQFSSETMLILKKQLIFIHVCHYLGGYFMFKDFTTGSQRDGSVTFCHDFRAFLVYRGR